MLDQKFFVGRRIFVNADAEDGAAVGRDFILKGVERADFSYAWRAPRRPEIQDDHFAAEIAEVGGAAIQCKREIVGAFAGDAGFALAVAGN